MSASISQKKGLVITREAFFEDLVRHPHFVRFSRKRRTASSRLTLRQLFTGAEE